MRQRQGIPVRPALDAREVGIEHRHIRPRRPQQDVKVERSRRIDAEEFWGRVRFRSFAEATTALREWEHVWRGRLRNASQVTAAAVAEAGPPILHDALSNVPGLSAFLLSDFASLRVLGGLAALTMLSSSLGAMVLVLPLWARVRRGATDS